MAPIGNDPPKRAIRTRGSWRVAVIAGIPIRVHLTFALLILWIALSSAVAGLGPTATVVGVILVFVVFAIIVIHELGHALMARRFGVRTREILLLPIGGIASLERIPDRPTQELAIAVVGPAINLVIAGLLWLGLTATGHTVHLGAATSLGGMFAVQLMWINVALAAFNLIPAFPMDGGRALRALLSLRLGRGRATEIAGTLGKLFALVLGIYGLIASPWLALIAVVIWLGARQELQTTRVREAIRDVPVSAAMNRQIHTVAPEESLEEAARWLVASGQNQVPIVDHGAPVGVLTRGDIATGLARGGTVSSVAAAPHHEAMVVGPADPLIDVFDVLTHSPETVAVVVEQGIPIGILSPEQIASFVVLRERPSAPS